jgi:hypothetical protein
MVEADSHLKLLPPSMLDIYKVFEHIAMLSMGVQYQPYTVIVTQLGSYFGALSHLWSQPDVIMSWLRLTATSSCLPHPYLTYTKCLSTLLVLSLGIQYQSYPVIVTQLGSDFGALGHLSSQRDVIMPWLRLTATSNCFPHPYLLYTK